MRAMRQFSPAMPRKQRSRAGTTHHTKTAAHHRARHDLYDKVIAHLRVAVFVRVSCILWREIAECELDTSFQINVNFC